MIKYLKYIILIFGSIGILAASFFIYQNRIDLKVALNYRSIIDYEYLEKHCLNTNQSYYYPCLKEKYQDYLKLVSFTGTNIGLRMMFSVMEEDKLKAQSFVNENHKNMVYTVNYLEINNFTMDNAYKKYFGLKSLYGGFLATLSEYYIKAQRFSEDLIRGLESKDGLGLIDDEAERLRLKLRFEKVKQDYYRIKEEAADFIRKETVQLKSKFN